MPVCHVSDVVQVIESLAPTRLAEPWDNVGLLIGDPNEPVERVLLTIDLGPAQLAEAAASRCQLIIAYHPPIFKGLMRLGPGVPAYDAVRAGIAVYSPHTALDVAIGGTNDTLAQQALGLTECTPLKPHADHPGGIGRVGVLSPPMTRPALLQKIKRALGVEHVLVCGPTEGLVERAAVCAGACGDILHLAIEHQAQLYLTGELRHHDALIAARNNLTVVCALHSNSERLMLPRLKQRLLTALPHLETLISQHDRDPFEIL